MADVRRRDAISLFTGGSIRPLDPRSDDVTLEDIGHSLGNQCRYTGHTREFYSVAQHSLLVASIVPEEDVPWALLHDASEAYLSDIARPVKLAPGFGEVYKGAEDLLTEAVAERFGLNLPMPESVKVADDIVLATEIRDLMTPGPIWDKWLEHEALPEVISPWGPRRARQAFKRRLKEVFHP